PPGRPPPKLGRGAAARRPPRGTRVARGARPSSLRSTSHRCRSCGPRPGKERSHNERATGQSCQDNTPTHPPKVNPSLGRLRNCPPPLRSLASDNSEDTAGPRSGLSSRSLASDDPEDTAGPRSGLSSGSLASNDPEDVPVLDLVVRAHDALRAPVDAPDEVVAQLRVHLVR